VPGPHQVTAALLTGPHQIPGRLGTHRGDADRRVLVEVQQPGEMDRVAGIGLDPVTGRPQQLRGRHHLAADPRRGQSPVQAEPGRARLVGHRDRSRQSPDPVPDMVV
jgi:hypothetical protein